MPRLLGAGKCWLSSHSPSPTLATPNSPLPFYRSCDVFGSSEEVQVDRHASRLVEGEGKPKLSPPCIPPRPNQPFRLLYQNPPCIPSHCRPTLPSWHPLLSSTHTHYHPAQPHRNTPTRPIQSSGCSERQGPTFPPITLASPLTLFLLLSFL